MIYSLSLFPLNFCMATVKNHTAKSKHKIMCCFIDETEGIKNDLAAAWLLLEMMVNYNMMRGAKPA